ncbi:hypothetical protein DNTS_015097, partial [Danionella cerebrum]
FANYWLSSPSVIISPVESEQSHLIPVALDNLSPHHFAVFLFGCHVVRLLSRACAFPSVMLLLARMVPVSHCDNLLAYCHKDFYYDASNQILYIQEKNVQNVGQFVSVLLHSMAFITSGSKSSEFMKAFHLAISAVSMELFHYSFSEDQKKGLETERPQEAFGTFVEDFFSAKIPPETHFSPNLLMERLQVYKYFKLEHLLQELKPTLKERHVDGLGPAGQKTQLPVLSVEQELNRLEEVYQQLSSEFSQTPNRHNPPETIQPTTFQKQHLTLEPQSCALDQRLKEIRDRLLSSSQGVSPDDDFQTPHEHKADAVGEAEKHKTVTGQSSNKKKQSKHVENNEEQKVNT